MPKMGREHKHHSATRSRAVNWEKNMVYNVSYLKSGRNIVIGSENGHAISAVSYSKMSLTMVLPRK